ncbi:MAG: hypothetical protein ACXWLH_04935 [Candidatus Saccharimonadales bacterium]
MVDVSDAHNVSVYTPIEEFVHPDSGSVVEVVSTIHVGSPLYYYDLQRHLQLRAEEGFLIGQEAIKAPTIAELRQATAAELDKYELFKTVAKYSGKAALGVERSDSFTYQYELYTRLEEDPLIPNIINTDVSMIEIARNARYIDLTQSVLSAYGFWWKMERAFKKGPEAYDQAIYDVIVKNIKEDKAKQMDPPNKGDKLMVHDRNEAVLGGVDTLLDEDPATKIALVWGFGHRHGLVEGIEQRGYRPKRISFVTVAMNPTLFR